MGDGVHLTVDQLHVLSLMRGEWDGIAKRVANEAQVFGAARNRVEDFKRRKEWAPIGRISEVAERVFNLLKKLMAVTSVRELTPYERSQYVDLLMLVMEFGRSCRPGSYAGWYVLHCILSVGALACMHM